MKPHCKPLATTLAACLQLAAIAAVPVAWTNSPGMPPYPIKPLPHGSTVDLAVTLKGYTTPPIADGADVRLWYQTNGMGQAWWSAPATFDGSTITATFGPAQDCGADRVSLFFGAPSNVFASAVLRLTHSPGFTPSALPLPVPALDFATVELRNIFSLTNGWSFGSAIDLADATNYTDRALGAFAATGAVARASVYGTSTRWTDATGCVWEVVSAHFTEWEYSGVPSGYVFSMYFDGAFPGYSWSLERNGGGEYYSDIFYTDEDGEEYEAARTSLIIPTPLADVTCTREWIESGTNLVGRVALTADIPPATDLAPIEREIADVRAESALVYRLYSGSNVVAEVTNYNSSVHAPELRLMQLNESNEYVTVWAEKNGLVRTLASARQYTDEAITNRAAPRAWSKVTAGLGMEAPSNTTWLSTARTAIAGGLEYEKHVTSGGAIWLLESNGMTADFHPQTNNTAYLDLSNADGTPIFRVEKTDSFLVGVHVDAVTVDGNALVCAVGVVAADPPLVRVRRAGEARRDGASLPRRLCRRAVSLHPPVPGDTRRHRGVLGAGTEHAGERDWLLDADVQARGATVRR